MKAFLGIFIAAATIAQARMPANQSAAAPHMRRTPILAFCVAPKTTAGIQGQYGQPFDSIGGNAVWHVQQGGAALAEAADFF